MSDIQPTEALGKYTEWLSVFSYCPGTGIILKNNNPCGSITRKGYLLICHSGIKIMAHRLAWILYYGSINGTQIDHINGNRLDNRISNLRISSPRLNGLNKNIHRCGRMPGWSKRKDTGKYRAEIAYNGRNIYLGQYDNEKDAAAAYQTALRNVLEGRHPVFDDQEAEIIPTPGEASPVVAKCDLCDKTISGEEAARWFRIGWDRKLCDSCYLDFQNWVKAKHPAEEVRNG